MFTDNTGCCWLCADRRHRLVRGCGQAEHAASRDTQCQQAPCDRHCRATQMACVCAPPSPSQTPPHTPPPTHPPTLKSTSPHSSRLDCRMRQLSPDRPRSTAGSSSGMQLRAYASTKQRPADSAASRTPSACGAAAEARRQAEQQQQCTLLYGELHYSACLLACDATHITNLKQQHTVHRNYWGVELITNHTTYFPSSGTASRVC